jgi:hypothetical protein
MNILIMVVALADLVVAIMVLVKLFQNEGALKGILGLICGLYTFIWGWMNANRLGIKNLMIIWTLLIILLIVLQVVFGGAMAMRGMPTTP